MKIVSISILNMIIQGVTMLLSLSFASKFLEGTLLRDWNLGIASYAFVALFDFGASTFILRDLSSSKVELVSKASNLTKTMIISVFSLSLFLIALNVTIFNKTYFLFIIGAMLSRVVTNISGVTNAAYGKVTIEKESKILFSITMLITQYLLLYFSVGIYSLPISIFLSSIFQFLFLFLTNDILRNLFISSEFTLMSIWSNKQEHLNWVFYTLPAFFIYNFQIFAIGIWSKPDDVPLFNAIHQLLYMVISVGGVVSYVSGPAISRLNYISQDTRNLLISYTSKIVSFSVALGLSFILHFIPIIQKTMFENIHLDSNHNLWIFYAFFIVLEVFQMTMVNALIYTGYTNFWKVNLISALLNVTFCWLFIRKFGIHGAIVSVVLAQFLTCNFFNIRTAIRILKLPRKETLTNLIFSLLMFTIINSIGILFRDSIYLSGIFFISIGLAFLIYILKPIKFVLFHYSQTSLDENRPK